MTVEAAPFNANSDATSAGAEAVAATVAVLTKLAIGRDHSERSDDRDIISSDGCDAHSCAERSAAGPGEVEPNGGSPAPTSCR
jgi:hypothetical protein